MNRPGIRNALRHGEPSSPAPPSSPSPSRWHKFSALTCQQKRSLFLACLLIPIFRARVHWRRRVTARQYAALLDDAGSTRHSGGAMLTRAEVGDLATAVNIAATHGLVRGNCVVRSLALLWLLRRRGVAAALRIGVRLAGATLFAHAWVEVDGRPINDRADIGQYYLPFAESIPVAAFTH